MGFNAKFAHVIGTHEAHAKLAEAWFTFLSFVALTTVFHAAAEKTHETPIIALKWVCYFLLFNWVYFKVCKLIWFIYPPADIEKNEPSNIVLGISIWLSSMVMIGAYALGIYLFEVFANATS